MVSPLDHVAHAYIRIFRSSRLHIHLNYSHAEVADGLMRLMMNVRAWAEARPAYEAAQEKDRLISEIQHIESREREQGMFVFYFWGAPMSYLILVI